MILLTPNAMMWKLRALMQKLLLYFKAQYFVFSQMILLTPSAEAARNDVEAATAILRLNIFAQ